MLFLDHLCIALFLLHVPESISASHLMGWATGGGTHETLSSNDLWAIVE